MGLYLWIGLGILFLIAISGIRIVRPTHRMLIETLGKYTRTASQGFNWVVPMIQASRYVNITEQMIDAEEQEIITQDRLNATVDAQVYFKVKNDDVSVMNSQYNVQDHVGQIVALSKTTLRNIIGNMSYEDANSQREKINLELTKILRKEAAPWGIDIVRTEMKQIEPPKHVQDSMNAVIKAENTRKAAVDLATAIETEADGKRRARIKEAEGQKQFSILVAEGKAQAFKLINESFKGNAQLLKKYEVTETSLKNNSKVILTEKGINPQLIIGELPLGNK